MSSGAIKSHIFEYYKQLYNEEHNGRFSSIPIATGRELAKSLGYDAKLSDTIPEDYWENFLPCGNIIPHMNVAPGDRILNLGCGVGIDTFALFMQFGSSIEVVGVDVVFGALEKASGLFSSGNVFQHASQTRFFSVCGDAEMLPFQQDSFDWIIMNGVFNLFCDKVILLREVKQVLKPGGTLIAADLCRTTSLPDYFLKERDSWAWCMSGACTEEELITLIQDMGFCEILLNREEELDMFYRVLFSCHKSQ